VYASFSLSGIISIAPLPGLSISFARRVRRRLRQARTATTTINNVPPAAPPTAAPIVAPLLPPDDTAGTATVAFGAAVLDKVVGRGVEIESYLESPVVSVSGEVRKSIRTVLLVATVVVFVVVVVVVVVVLVVAMADVSAGHEREWHVHKEGLLKLQSMHIRLSSALICSAQYVRRVSASIGNIPRNELLFKRNASRPVRNDSSEMTAPDNKLFCRLLRRKKNYQTKQATPGLTTKSKQS